MKGVFNSLDKLLLKEKIVAGGSNKLLILSDFDRTLTYGFVNGVKTPSIISLLRDGKHLTEGYADKAVSLFNKYSPFENDSSLTKIERVQYMLEWWQTHFDLLIESGLNITDIQDIVHNNKDIKLRSALPQILDLLYDKKIPLIIYSASGCGEAIPMYFELIKRKYNNIFFVVNRFNWDNNGNAISVHEPIITTANKNGKIFDKFPEILRSIRNRSNIILLGDSLDDVEMANGLEFETILKIGLVNNVVGMKREQYSKSFDIVLEANDELGYLRDLLMEVR